jgi:hypothetical protein
VCRTRPVYTGRACADCVNDLGRILHELEGYWRQLGGMKEPTRGQAGRMTPGYGSRPPLRLDVLAALDPKSLPTAEDDVWSIPGTIDRIADWIAVLRGEPTGQGLDYIAAQLRWCAGQLEFETVAEALHELHRRAQALAGDRPVDLGRCISVTAGRTCHGRVREGGRDEPARCESCKRPYTGLALVRLRVAQDTAA